MQYHCGMSLKFAQAQGNIFEFLREKWKAMM